MSLNPQYIPLYQLQQYFVDKATGAPLSGGKVYFYSDVNRTIPKTVYELSSTTGTYTYVPLPNPIILSSVGTPVDVNGNDIVIYAFPFDAFGNPELYYVVVQDADGRPQFTREAVPNSGSGSTPGNDANLFNYVPNGQFLVHTDVPNIDHELVAGTNVIAQGGFTVELSNPLGSINTLEFIPLGFTENPENSPRYLARFTAVTFDPGDTIKNIRIKWNDVNKFSANDDFYTFAFWGEGNVNIPISIQIVKFFGTTGTVVPPDTIFTDTITTTGDIHQYQFQFGQNVGDIVDTVNNNDFVAIDIALPRDFGFQLDITNFVLVNGQQVLTAFPLQTNADMITRGNDGWTDLPNPNGDDLLLPKVQTRIGYEYAEWEVGDIGATVGNIVSPLSASPLPRGNRMLLDGAVYPFDGYSTIGVPFERLGNFLVENSSVANTPMFGTGKDFATAYATTEGDDTIFRITVNSNGIGVNYATEGGILTGFAFTGIPVYNGSIVGSNSVGYNAYSSGVAGNQIICKSITFNVLADATPGTTPFTINSFAPNNSPGVNSIYSYQTYYFILHAVAAAALVTGPLNPGMYYTFSSDTTNYYVWFNVTGEVDPLQPGTPIQVNLQSTDGGNVVASVLREVMNAYQSTSIHVMAPPPDGSYFTFQANPALVQNYHVWYAYSTASIEPIVGGSTAIRVNILGGDTDAQIVTKTILAINTVQYAVPDAQGMFLRNADPSGIWDFDNLTRWSTITGMVGPNVGTFEYSQLLNHAHELPDDPNDGGSPVTHTAQGPSGAFSTQSTGGSETRPVNMYVNYYIKY